MNFINKSFFFFILFSIFSTLGFSQITDSIIVNDTIVPKIRKQSFFDLLSNSEEEVINATLTTDMNKFEDPRNKLDYWDGIFVLENSSEEETVFDVEVRLRGMFRLIKCDFPPLKLKFKKKGLKKSGLRKRYNKMKLVTHCMEDSEQSEDLILREYLAYKLFNIINEHSFRVQLVKMKYVNTEKKRDKRKGLGILVEDSKEVADRIGGVATDAMGIKDSLHNQNQEQTTSLFQFMIANTDWDNIKNRNVKLIETEEDEVFSVPYDFDFSGFVSAPYARLTKVYGQSSLKDRVFLGQAKTIQELEPTIELFKSHKTEILDEISNFTLLSRSSRKDLKQFIEEFYETLENKDDLENALFKVGKE